MNVNNGFDLPTATFVVLLITLVVTLIDKTKK